MSPSDQIVPLVVAVLVMCFIIIGAGFGMLYYALLFTERFEEILRAKEPNHSAETVKAETSTVNPRTIAALKHTRPEIRAFHWPPLQPTVKREVVGHRNLES